MLTSQEYDTQLFAKSEQELSPLEKKIKHLTITRQAYDVYTGERYSDEWDTLFKTWDTAYRAVFHTKH